MGDEIKRYLDEVRDDIKITVDHRCGELERRIQENQNISLESHETTRRHVQVLNRKVSALWETVKGSDPPPPPNGRPKVPRPTSKPMDEQVTDHDLALASIQGHLINVNARTNRLDEKANTLEGKVDKLTDLQVKQTQVMGIKTEPETRKIVARVLDGIGWLFKEREGQKFILSTIAAVTGLIAAIGTCYAIMSGKPLPTELPKHGQTTQAPHP